jgi:ribosome-associated toxin RatA of RatAB toxin-antitoxin module
MLAMQLRRSALVGFPAAAMFDLIEAAEHYPAFVPWCVGTTILARDDAVVAAEIRVDYRGVCFSFTTRNPKRRPEWLGVRLERGPFRRFEGDWHITSLAPAACKVEFVFQYELGGRLSAGLARPVFDHVATALIDAFVARAEHMHRPTDGGEVVPIPR